MRRGAWHQLGYNAQKVALEQLELKNAVGVIIGARDLTHDNAVEYSKKYRGAGGGVLLDPQFYEPEYSEGKLATYPLAKFRRSIGELGALPQPEFDSLTRAIEQENRAIVPDAIIAPAIPFEAARPDIIDLNARLFEAAKNAGNYLGIPTYGTVVLGQSSTAEDVSQNILSSATALNADGWYYNFEFGSDQLPTDIDAVYRYCSAGLTLACSGKPVIHACAGPLALISFGAGARAAGIGFWQNLWGFQRSRWRSDDEEGQGGGGDAPPRFFSVPLWGRIIHPDETAQLTAALVSRIMAQSPFSVPTTRAGVPWSKWDANKHLVHVICESITPLANLRDARRAMNAAGAILEDAVRLHGTVLRDGVRLKDNTSAYQRAWSAAGARMLQDNSDDYDYLEMIGGP